MPAAWRPGPLVFGLPPAFVWVVAWLAVIFGTLVWIYRADAAGDGGPRSEGAD